MILQGWPILSVLLFCSLLSLTVMWERWKAFQKATKAVSHTIDKIADKIDHAASKEDKERVLQHEVLGFTSPLEAHLSILATIAATAPFIGLLGTVIGIIRSFQAVSVSMGGGHAVVALGIAEALIATAFGLFVAIPAVVAYNYFARRLEVIEQKIILAVSDIILGRKR